LAKRIRQALISNPRKGFTAPVVQKYVLNRQKMQIVHKSETLIRSAHAGSRSPMNKELTMAAAAAEVEEKKIGQLALTTALNSGVTVKSRPILKTWPKSCRRFSLEMYLSGPVVSYLIVFDENMQLCTICQIQDRPLR